MYLFGSRAADRTDPEADFDFAILTTPSFGWDDLFRLHVPLKSALESGRFDIVWLNRADPVIAFEVTASGRCLWFRDTETLNDFELKARKRFWDYSIYLKKHEDMWRHGIQA